VNLAMGLLGFVQPGSMPSSFTSNTMPPLTHTPCPTRIASIRRLKYFTGSGKSSCGGTPRG
jgi:hypothetical protein